MGRKSKAEGYVCVYKAQHSENEDHGIRSHPFMRNRFKGLDLIDRVPDELWNNFRDIVQETGIKTIPMEKKCKNAKWLSGEALQIAHTLYICIFMSYFIWSHHFMGNR